MSRADGAATDLERASLGGIEENHAMEQFFYDDETTKRLLRVAKGYAKPVFMCNPSLARACVMLCVRVLCCVCVSFVGAGVRNNPKPQI